MPRYALVDASEATAAAVEAALGAISVARCSGDRIPQDAALAIVACPAGRRRLDPESLAFPSPSLPVLFLGNPGAAVLDALRERPHEVLKKSFDLMDLRRTVRALLGQDSRNLLPGAETTAAPWLEAPRVPAEAVRVLAGAARLRTAVWVLGEAGTGTDEVAAALAHRWDPARPPVIWQEHEDLSAALSVLEDDDRVLWVPLIEDRSADQQRQFERALALNPRRRVVVTSRDNVEESLASGALAPSVHQRLSRVSLRLPPLRRRRREVVDLALVLGSEAAAALLGAEHFSLSRQARSILEDYPWSGNVVELESVITRSLLQIDAGQASAVELGAADLRFAPAHLVDDDLDDDKGRDDDAEQIEGREQTAQAAAASPPALRAVVLPLPSRPSPRADAADSAVDIENLLAVFAHDIRNPLSTLKTYATLQAADAGEDEAELASLAMAASDRLDEQLGLLQRYGELSREPRDQRAAAPEVDLVDVLGEALDAADPSGECLEIAARRSLTAFVDATLARFVADAVVAECRARTAPSAAGAKTDSPRAIADIASAAGHGAFLEIRIPLGRAAVDRLDRWVEGTGLPWRVALARDAARRGGGDLQVDVVDGQMRLSWRPPPDAVDVAVDVDDEPDEPPRRRAEEAEEEDGSHDKQTDSPDRRRRSRGS